MNVEEVADELYGLPLEEFIPARTAREKEAKAAGDKELAAVIKTLAKPNQVAWLANQLVREHPDEIEPLLALGSELRGAAESLTPQQLQEFSRRQRQLVSALVQKGKQLGHQLGKKISGDTAQGLQGTLQAALADPEAGDRLMQARLVDGMQHVGFGAGGPSSGIAAKIPTGRTVKHTTTLRDRSETPKKDRAQLEIEKADKDVERAESLARDAVELRDDAESELRDAKSAVKDLECRVAKLRAKLDDAEEALTTANRDHRRLRTSFERVDKTAQDAAARLKRAQAARQRLDES